MLFLTDVDHVGFEKANETRQNNLQSATVSLQVVIGLCRRKETAALIFRAALSLRLHKPMTTCGDTVADWRLIYRVLFAFSKPT